MPILTRLRLFTEGFLTCFFTTSTAAAFRVHSWSGLFQPDGLLPISIAVVGATICGLRRINNYNAGFNARGPRP